MTAIAHVGVSVPDLRCAADWYGDVLGLDRLGDSIAVTGAEGHSGRVAADVLGPACATFEQAHLVGSNGVGIELFQFAEGVAPEGIFHLCVVAADVRRTAERIASSGGRRTSRIWPIFPNEPYLTCYCEDPFGNTIELYSHSHERTYANR